ncbi:17838_t:CDS:2 [Cetraspora pellucida]|uniref:17838_t:CDS:1 n=1 Tax=Cetraspora pellucida TaxID=1433469 RepID=A0ACA9K819_9GLOM|nr:17838_t:CDS:2 [Cetraspora pellucida]
MTATPAPVTSNEHDSRLFHNTRNRIASLSSKNKEILDQISQLHQSHSQALSVINSQLDIPHSTTGTIQDIDDLNAVDVMEVEKDNEINETTGSIDDSLSFMGRSSKISIANRNSKDSIRMDNLSPNANNVGELDWKYLSAEHNSDSENANEISGSVDDKEFKINDDLSNRRRNSKSHLTLTINTNTKSSKSTRLITPESSDSEFDISNAHMPLASSLGGSINPLRVPRHSSAELYKGSSIIEKHGRPVSMTFSSMDEVIEEERGSLSDIAEQEAANVRTSDNGVRTRNKLMARKKRSQKYTDDYSEKNNVSRTNKINNRQADDSYSVNDIHDDNSSIMSNESFIDELNALRSRIQKLESVRGNVDDDSTSEKRSRKKKNSLDQAISPSATSPVSSQGGASSTNTGTSRRTLTAVQHNKHLESAFEFFEKAFTNSDQSTNDTSPPPSHSMAMVVSTALYLNSNLRNVISQMETGGQPSEKYMKILLKTSDEQIRSLTECLLALAPLGQKKAPAKKDSYNSLLQMPTTSTRPISPNQRILSAPTSEVNHHELRRISPTPPTDQSSPPTYYTTQRASLYNRMSRPPSPGLPPENYDPQFTQVPSTRAADYRERRNRRYSGSTYGGSYSGPFPPPSSSPSPPPVQPSHYEQSNGRTYFDRETPRLQRYQSLNNVPSLNNTPLYQRPQSRPASIIRTDDSSYTTGHMRSASNSSLFRSSSGRSYVQRDEFVNSPVSTSRQSRTYDHTRRYQSENGQSQIDRRQVPISEMDRKYGRRTGGNYEPDEVFDSHSGYGDHVSDKNYTLREEKSVLRRDDNTDIIHKQRLAPQPDEQTHNNGVERRVESRNEGQDETRNDGSQEGRQANSTNNNNVVENGVYI